MRLGFFFPSPLSLLSHLLSPSLGRGVIFSRPSLRSAPPNSSFSMVIRRLLPSSVVAGPAPPPLSSPLTLSCPRPPRPAGAAISLCPFGPWVPRVVPGLSPVRPPRSAPRGVRGPSAAALPGGAGAVPGERLRPGAERGEPRSGTGLSPETTRLAWLWQQQQQRKK